MGNLHRQRWDSCATFTAITDEKALTGRITLSLGAYINLKSRHQMIKTHCFVQLGSKHSLQEKLCFRRLLPEHGEKNRQLLFLLFKGAQGCILIISTCLKLYLWAQNPTAGRGDVLPFWRNSQEGRRENKYSAVFEVPCCGQSSFP